MPGGPCLLNCSNLQSRGFYGFHNGVHFAMADGSARFFADSTSTRVIAFLITSQRGEAGSGE